MRLSRLCAHRHLMLSLISSRLCIESLAEVSSQDVYILVRDPLLSVVVIIDNGDVRVNLDCSGQTVSKHFGPSSPLRPRPPSRPDVSCRRRPPQALDARHQQAKKAQRRLGHPRIALDSRIRRPDFHRQWK